MIDDLVGIARPQGVAHDIGAYEFVAGTGIPDNPGSGSVFLGRNPTSDRLRVLVGSDAVGSVYHIVDLVGAVMMKGRATGQHLDLDLSGFAAGTYMLWWSDRGGPAVRVVKE